jgi:hypothetical protein
MEEVRLSLFASFFFFLFVELIAASLLPLQTLESTLLFLFLSCLPSAHRILCGIQVPPASTNEFGEWLAALKYPYVEETQNPAYADFLGDEETESEAEQ